MTSEISIEMATTEVDLPSGTAIVNMRGFRQNGQKKDKETVIKAVLLGDYSVGKTTLFKRIREKELSLSTSWNSQSLDLCNLSIDLPNRKKVQVSMYCTMYLAHTTNSVVGYTIRDCTAN